MTSDSNGNVFIGGSIGNTRVIIKYNRDLRVASRFELGARVIALDDMAVDALGNVLLVGSVGNGDGPFPVVNPPAGIPALPTNFSGGFVARIDSGGKNLISSWLLGGTDHSSETSIHAVTLDASGNIYLAGTTNAVDFPTTPDAYQKSVPLLNSVLAGYPRYAFLMKLNSAGDRILYSTVFGDPATLCEGGSRCAGVYGVTSPQAVAVAPNGAVTIAGLTTATKLPVTPGAIQPNCNCKALGHFTGFVARFRPGLSTLDWLTYLGGSGSGFRSGDSIDALALTADGGVIVAGGTTSPDFPTTPGVLQPAGHKDIGGLGVPANAFVSRLNSSGTALIYSTYLGGSVGESATSLQVDSEGHAWVIGGSGSADFPLLPGSLNLPGSFYVELSPDGTRLLQSARLPGVGTSLVFATPGVSTVLNANGSIFRFSSTAMPSSMLFGQANAAGFTTAAVVAPGEIISFYGIGLGPAKAVTATLDAAGKLPVDLGGTQILFDGVSAPLLYAADRQINAVVPFAVAGKTSTSIVIRTPSGATVTLAPDVVATYPRIVTTGSTASAAAINQDGTVNSPSNRAARGSVLAFWLSGAGLFDRPLADGTIVQPPLPRLRSIPYVTIDGIPAAIVYAGAAPGLVAGAAQIDIEVPRLLPAGGLRILQITVGGVAIPPVRVEIE